MAKKHLIDKLKKGMLNEAKLLKEPEEKLFGAECKIIKTIDWDSQEELTLLEEKSNIQKSKSENKIKELIKGISEIEVMITEKINELNRTEENLKKMRMKVIFYKELIA